MFFFLIFLLNDILQNEILKNPKQLINQANFIFFGNEIVEI